MKKLFIANWKSNKNIQESSTWVEQFAQQIAPHLVQEDFQKEIVIAPPFTAFVAIQTSLQNSHLQLQVNQGPYGRAHVNL